MRIILAIAVAATFVIAAWTNNPSVADAGSVSMNPIDMMTTPANLPSEQYDAI